MESKSGPYKSAIVSEEAFEYNLSLGNGFLRIHEHGELKTRYWMGEFMHPSGVVTVYRQSDYTRLDFIANGRGHSRAWRKYWGDRTINRLAREMIRDFSPAPESTEKAG